MPEILALFTYSFMIKALIASILTAVLSATIGSFTVLRNLSTMGAAIAHASLAGALVAFFFGVEPAIGAAILSVFFALAAAYSGKRGSGSMDIALGVTFGFSAALAAFMLSLTREYTVVAYSYLIGEVLGVTDDELLLLGVFTLASLILVLIFYKEIKFITFDREAAEAMGVNASLFHYLLIVLIAVTTVVELKVVGSILAVVFLVAPAAAALEFSHSLEKMIILSILFALSSSIMGILISAVYNLPASPTIGILASLIYLLALVFSPKRKCCRI